MKPIEDYRFTSGERWEGSTRVPEPPPSPARRRAANFAARARARSALAAQDPNWDQRSPRERTRFIDNYIAMEAKS
jgi:hypothetical protein